VVVEGASGNERVHLTHVTDIAEATCRAALHPSPAYRIYNVGGPDDNYVALKDFHAAVQALVPHAGAVIWRGEGRSAGPVDTCRLRDDLGVDPRVSVVEGLKRDLGIHGGP
jgi:nucleoside-diphosphate-sugar epimerase